jgi:hypothetical protein
MKIAIAIMPVVIINVELRINESEVFSTIKPTQLVKGPGRIGRKLPAIPRHIIIEANITIRVSIKSVN